jgi:hypothetical protein
MPARDSRFSKFQWVPVFLALPFGSYCFGESQSKILMITYSDIPSRVQITGKLSRPLG